MKFIKNNLVLIIVDVSASTEAFVGTVCLIAVRRSVLGQTGCRRCGRVGKTPRLCSSTCLAPFWYVSPPWSICPLCCLLCRWLWPDPNLWRGWGIAWSVTADLFCSPASDLLVLWQPVRPKTEWRTAIRQIVPTKASFEAETSTIINKRLFF